MRTKITLITTKGKRIIEIQGKNTFAEHIVTKKEAKWLVKALAEML